jgi:hypothetical protein
MVGRPNFNEKKPAFGAKDGLDKKIVNLVACLPEKEKELVLELVQRLVAPVNKQSDSTYPYPTANQVTAETPTNQT